MIRIGLLKRLAAEAWHPLAGKLKADGQPSCVYRRLGRCAGSVASGRTWALFSNAEIFCWCSMPLLAVPARGLVSYSAFLDTLSASRAIEGVQQALRFPR